jgi:hypothetical protein
VPHPKAGQGYGLWRGLVFQRYYATIGVGIVQRALEVRRMRGSL